MDKSVSRSHGRCCQRPNAPLGAEGIHVSSVTDTPGRPGCGLRNRVGSHRMSGLLYCRIGPWPTGLAPRRPRALAAWRLLWLDPCGGHAKEPRGELAQRRQPRRPGHPGTPMPQGRPTLRNRPDPAERHRCCHRKTDLPPRCGTHHEDTGHRFIVAFQCYQELRKMTKSDPNPAGNSWPR